MVVDPLVQNINRVASDYFEGRLRSEHFSIGLEGLALMIKGMRAGGNVVGYTRVATATLIGNKFVLLVDTNYK